MTLASHLKSIRQKYGFSLQNLASRSGISRATLSRYENGTVSPTADALSQLSRCYQIPISSLLAPLEESIVPLIRRNEQHVWQDAVNGFERRSISPPATGMQVELIACHLAPNAEIAYQSPSVDGHEHHLVMTQGTLRVTLGEQDYALSEGDCLRYKLYGASAFHAGDKGAHYMLALNAHGG